MKHSIKNSLNNSAVMLCQKKMNSKPIIEQLFIPILPKTTPNSI